MNNAIKTHALTEIEARKIAGNDAVDKVLGENCDFTSRVINECCGVTEMGASVDFSDADGNDSVLTVLYLVDSEELAKTEDLGDLDYTNYTFEII